MSILVVADMAKTANYEYTRSIGINFQTNLTLDWLRLFGFFFLIQFCKMSNFKKITSQSLGSHALQIRQEFTIPSFQNQRRLVMYNA